MKNSQSIVLACTDGSSYADSVYDHAAWVAEKLGAHVHVLHVHRPERKSSDSQSSAKIGDEGTRKSLKAHLSNVEIAQQGIASAKASAILGAARAHLRSQNIQGFHVESREGDLTEVVAKSGANTELVVIGKRGEAADFEKLHLGANVERIIRSSPFPVLVTSRAYKPIKHVLVAYDGGRSVVKAIDYLVERPLFKDCNIQLLAVGNPHPKIEEDLIAVNQRLIDAGFSVNYSYFKGNPEEVIPQFITDYRVDLLVMGAYGHSRIRHLIVGSTTTAMVRTSRIPILMFR